MSRLWAAYSRADQVAGAGRTRSSSPASASSAAQDGPNWYSPTIRSWSSSAPPSNPQAAQHSCPCPVLPSSTLPHVRVGRGRRPGPKCRCRVGTSAPAAGPHVRTRVGQSGHGRRGTVRARHLTPSTWGSGATVTRLEEFTGDQAWTKRYGAEVADDGAEGRLVSLHTFNRPVVVVGGPPERRGTGGVHRGVDHPAPGGGRCGPDGGPAGWRGGRQPPGRLAHRSTTGTATCPVRLRPGSTPRTGSRDCRPQTGIVRAAEGRGPVGADGAETWEGGPCPCVALPPRSRSGSATERPAFFHPAAGRPSPPSGPRAPWRVRRPSCGARAPAGRPGVADREPTGPVPSDRPTWATRGLAWGIRLDGAVDWEEVARRCARTPSVPSHRPTLVAYSTAWIPAWAAATPRPARRRRSPRHPSTVTSSNHAPGVSRAGCPRPLASVVESVRRVGHGLVGATGARTSRLAVGLGPEAPGPAPRRRRRAPRPWAAWRPGNALFRGRTVRGELRHGRPWGRVDRAGPPPRPHLLGHEGQHRRQQPQQHRQCGRQRRPGPTPCRGRPCPP